MHILELIKTGKEEIPCEWVLEAEMTHIISNLYSFEVFLENKEQKAFIKEIRASLMGIRHKIFDIVKLHREEQK